MTKPSKKIADTGAKQGNGDAGSGDPAYNQIPAPVGRVPSPGVSGPTPPRQLRRLHRVWPDRDGYISYLLTLCVEGRGHFLNNDEAFQRLVDFLMTSPTRYQWFGRRFVMMPDHVHLIAHMGGDAVRLGQWVKALKSMVKGKNGDADSQHKGNAGSGDPAYNGTPAPVGRVPSPGVRVPAWHWQEGYHDHKFRTPESESRKWEYICLNPVRAGLVKRPEDWPFGGEVFYHHADGPQFIRGTPPLLETGMLIVDDKRIPSQGTWTPR